MKVDRKGINVNGIPLDKALEEFVLKNLFGQNPETEKETEDEDIAGTVDNSDEKDSYDGTFSRAYSLTHSLT